MEDKLLFALVYAKTYPLQVVQGQLFGMSQASANEWIHFLVPVLARALDDLGVLPEREGAQVAQHKQRHAEPPDLIVDGAERRRQRPKNRDKQALHYSGKKKQHTDKNVVLVNARSKRISYLSPTLPGVVHDNALADWGHSQYPQPPPCAVIWASVGISRRCVNICNRKKRKRAELTPDQKRHNRRLARTRVRVEHAIAGIKICRITRDQLRNTKDGFSDIVMVIACGLHNLRVARRTRRHRSSNAYFRFTTGHILV